MKNSLAGKSIILFVMVVVLNILFTLLDPVLSDVPTTIQRLMVILLFVLPAMAGVVYGFLSLTRKEGKVAPAILGILLNGAFGLFNLLIVFIAG